jgi:hypothetical protein
MQYELFGRSPKELASLHDTQVSVIEYAIEQEGWKPNKAFIQDIALPEGDMPLNTFSEQVFSATKDKLKLLNAYRQDIFATQYMQLEAVILGKAIELAQSISATNPEAVKQIKILSETLQSMLKHNDLNATHAAEDEEKNGGVTVNIISATQAYAEVKQ